MSARVSWVQSNGEAWTILVRRNRDLDIDRREPPVTDLPPDIRAALKAWLRPEVNDG